MFFLISGVGHCGTSWLSSILDRPDEGMKSINELAQVIAEIAGIEIAPVHIEGPQGVRGRNSDNSLLREVLDWEPSVSLEKGLALTYAWIESRVRDRLRP